MHQVFASRSVFWCPCGLLLLYCRCAVPCFLVFPVVQLWYEHCCCLIDWALCLPCSVSDREAQSFGKSVISAQAAFGLAACFNILTRLSQLMNSIRDPWARTYKLMDKPTHMHLRILFFPPLCKSHIAVSDSPFFPLSYLADTFLSVFSTLSISLWLFPCKFSMNLINHERSGAVSIIW